MRFFIFCSLSPPTTPVAEERDTKEAENLIRYKDPTPALHHDVSPVLADAAVLSSVSHGLSALTSPSPATNWAIEAFQGRCAYIRTLNDRAIPYEVQNMMPKEATGQAWIIEDIETGHNPQLAAPERLCGIILDLAKQFQAA